MFIEQTYAQDKSVWSERIMCMFYVFFCVHLHTHSEAVGIMCYLSFVQFRATFIKVPEVSESSHHFTLNTGAEYFLVRFIRKLKFHLLHLYVSVYFFVCQFLVV